MDDLLREFLTETNESLDRVDAELVRFEQEPNNGEILGNIFRLVHTIKGTCGFLGLPRLEALAHSAENLMGEFRDGMPVTTEAVTVILSTIDRIKTILEELEAEQREPTGNDGDLIERLNWLSRRPNRALRSRARNDAVPPAPDRRERSDAAAAAAPTGDASAASAAERADADPGERLASQSIRVNVETLDRLMTTVSELVLTRNQLLEIVRRNEDSDFRAPLQRLSNVTAELQEGVMKTRMQPIGNAWQKLPRIVRDLSAELGKEIDLEMHGAETELDRQVLELVKDPLTHLVRNCADHGIESAAERFAAGKTANGRISLSACHQGGHIIIQIADDGRGLDLARIRAKAVESGLMSEAEIAAKTDGEICNFIFRPGFSTAAQVTSISGRGIGMDVVRANIEQIGGTVDLQSAAGVGTAFTIKIHHPGDRFLAPRRGRRRAFRHAAALGARARAGGQWRTSDRADQGHAGVAPAQEAVAAHLPQGNAAARRSRQRRLFRRGHSGRQPGFRHRGRRRVTHRGNRDQADVVEAAPHRGVFRHHDPRRRLGDHDHRP